MKLALAMIVRGDDKEADLLARCLGYAAGAVDGIFITITQPNEKVRQVAELYKATISEFVWCNDFAKARNFNFAQVPKDYTHILWLDADDGLRGGEKLRETIEKHPNVDAFSMFYLYAFDEFKRPVVVHHKTRVLKNDGCVEWAGAIHEDFKENRAITRFHINGIEVIHLTTGERVKVNMERNLEIAQEQMAALPDDPRSYWNVGNSLKGLGRNAEAIEMFKKFLTLSESDDEKYIVRLRMAESYWQMDDKEKALDEARYAIGFKPTYPDAYHLMGSLFFEMKEYYKARDMYMLGLTRKPPYYSIIVYNPRDYDFTPLMNLARTYFQLSLPTLALECLKSCAKIYPKDESIKVLIKSIGGEVDGFNDVIKLVKKLEKITDKKKLQKALDKVPKKYQSHPAICMLRNNKLVKEFSSGKDLVYYCGPTAEEWTPDTAKERGIGGSEEAVIHLSQQFADLGWNVTVYNNCGHEEQKFDKVTYKPFWMFNVKDKQDCVIIWRNAQIGDLTINSPRVYLDMHDAMPEGELRPERAARYTKIFVKSEFHRSLYPMVADERFAIVPNGIDSKIFTEDTKKEKGLVINTSSPDRSITAFIDIFAMVKKEIPWAKAKWAYGWQVFDVVHGKNPRLMEWKARTQMLLREAGIEEVGRLSHPAVADLYMRADVFLYPTEFAEIHCISAIKAQAAGAIPFTTDFAALAESVQFGIKMHSNKTKDTWCKPYQFDFSLEDSQKKRELADEIITYLKGAKISDAHQMHQWACGKYDWIKIADEWNTIFNQTKI